VLVDLAVVVPLVDSPLEHELQRTSLHRMQRYAHLDTDLTCRDRRHNLPYNKTAIQVDRNESDLQGFTIHVTDTHHHSC
jgi:hypothetical protein